MGVKIAILIALVCSNAQLISSDAENNYCYSDDKHPYLLAGTKTAYEIIHGSIENATLPNCKPVQIWMLIRHGTRYPGKDEINNMKHKLPDLQRSIVENHEKYGNGSLCKGDLEKLKSWQLDANLQAEKKKYLTKQGEIDLLTLGERFKNYFPQLLQGSSDGKYKFRSTDTQRTISSMKHFIAGLFNNGTVDNAEVIPESEDTLLRLYKICKRWQDLMDDPSTSTEVNKLINGPLFSHIVDKVSQRVGFPYSFSFDDVLIMYTACAFENAWHLDKHSPWCALFREEELKVFEYEQDLYYYYHASYGQEMSPKVGCQPLKDMFQHFTKLETGDSSEEPQGIFYFTHSTALQLFFTAMGIAKDSTPLTASNFQDMENRKWSTSHLAPFAANLAAVFYKCDSSNKVRLYLNQKPLDLEGCDLGVCDWEYLKKKMGPNAFNCSTDFCTV